MRLSQSFKILSVLSASCLWCAGLVRAQTATNITGLYYTGMNNSGGLLTQSSNTGAENSGTRDPHWSVSYASINGGTSTNATYQGSAYVLDSNAVSGSAYVQNTSTAQWVTAPGAQDPNNGNRVNSGGDFLPGNGNTGSHEGIYVYTLAFTITGSGAAGTLVTNGISISLTIAADDQASIYVNPGGYGGNGTTLPTGTAAYSVTSAWSNTSAATLQNGTDHTGTSGNSRFYIGTNYLTIVVDNTNGVNGSSNSNSLNASGLLVYQVGNAISIDGNPIQGVIPEVGTWLPVAAALGLFGWGWWRRRSACER